MSSICSKATMAQIYKPAKTLFEYADISAHDCIKPGLKIRDWIDFYTKRTYAVQRLTERSYLVGASGYNATFYVGNEGVLLISPQAGEATINTIEAIRSVTDLPIDAVVYSHYHLDHVEGVMEVIAESGQRFGKKPRIIGSDITAKRIEKFGNKIPLPTDVIEGHDGEVRFEDVTVRLLTPAKSGHCVDNAIIMLNEEGIAQFDDMLEPECMPYPDFGPTEDIIAYEDNLQELHDLDWTFVNGGHGNLGYKSDVKFYLDYLQNLRNSTGEVMERVAQPDFVVPTYSYMAWWLNYLKALSALVKEELRPKYGSYYGFEETVPTHVEMMANALILY